MLSQMLQDGKIEFRNSRTSSDMRMRKLTRKVDNSKIYKLHPYLHAFAETPRYEWH